MANSTDRMRMIWTALVCCALVLGLACGDGVGPFETAIQIHTQPSQGLYCVTVDGVTACEYESDGPDYAAPEDNQGGDPAWAECNYTDAGCEPCTYENYFCGDPGYTAPPPSTVSMANAADDEAYSCYAANPEPCTLRLPTSAERQKLTNEIAKIATTHTYCSQIKQIASDLLDRPAIAPNPNEGNPNGSPAGIQIWPEHVTQTKDGRTLTLYGDFQSVVIDHTQNATEIHLWEKAIFAKIIVHEVIHTLGGRHDTPYNTPDGRTMSAWVETCVPNTA